jgi:hypothetical protein
LSHRLSKQLTTDVLRLSISIVSDYEQFVLLLLAKSKIAIAFETFRYHGSSIKICHANNGEDKEEKNSFSKCLKLRSDEVFLDSSMMIKTGKDDM